MTTNLGTAGSRRTVYVNEESKAEEPSTSNGNGESATAAVATAPTFLMYNKISTTIAGKESPPPSVTNGNENQKKGDKKKNDQKGARESAIWYEYGCV